jgi:DNA-directed RNA polymerase specialized sigma24 family protein
VSAWTTNWSLILRAACGDDAEAELAMALLCEAYWYPVYAFVRRQGHSAADAEDLTQGYFARFLEKGFIGIRPEHGRFRAFVLVSVRNFLHNERDRVRALKRGGGRRLVSLDTVTAERTTSSGRRTARPPRTSSRGAGRRQCSTACSTSSSRGPAGGAERREWPACARS